MPLASRIGVCLDEISVGTNAPGVTAHTGKASVVMGGEHFFGCVQVMHCAAAPIRDVHGQVAGVLDLSSESRPFGFDAAAVVALYATSIENRLLRAQSSEHIVVHFQTWPSLIGTPMEGLAGISSDGRVAWVNSAAARLLGHPDISAGICADELFGLELHRLSALTRSTEATAHRLPCGLTVWWLARLQAPDGLASSFNLHDGAELPLAAGPLPGSTAGVHVHAPAAPKEATPSDTLRDAGLQLIEQTLAGCQGNVSMTARKLGVSRGLVYRHVKKAGQRTGG